ncbi:cytochrome P-450 cyp509A1 [Lichtheimia hyalospora FSU 10163]|nr:cytochrome P-450 cyp509A1 [Lichtheimia hyalospora FSU 10163]
MEATIDKLGPYLDSLQNMYPYFSSLVVGEQGSQLIYRHRVTISAAVALVSTYTLFKYATGVPHHLAHFPRLGFLDYIKAVYQGKDITFISQQLALPTAEKNPDGLYLRFDQDGWSVHITRPEAAKTFLLKTDLYPKVPFRTDTLFGRMIGVPQISSLNGREWLEHRKVVNPAFHRSMPVGLFGRLGIKLFTLIDDLALQGPIDVYDITERWTLDVIGLAAFGFDFNALGCKDNEWVHGYEAVKDGAFDPLYWTMPWLQMLALKFSPTLQGQFAQLERLEALIDDLVVEKRKALKEKQENNKEDAEKDILTLMIDAVDSGQGIMTDEELRNNVFGFFAAGHDTTANALAFIAYELAANPDMQSKAYKEAMDVLGDTLEDVLPTADQTRNMPYIDMLIKENLRLHPPGANIPARVATQDTQLGSTLIRKGTKISLEMYDIQHNPKVWHDPEMFIPERFATGAEADQLSQKGLYAWMPVSHGGRQCIGMQFSITEQRVLVPMLLRKYELILPDNSIHKNGLITQGISLVSPKNLTMIFKRRY